MNNQLLDEITILAADIFGVSRSAIHNDTTPADIDNWDSIQHVSFIIAIEAQFAVEFDPDEISHMESIGQIAGILAAKLDRRDSRAS